MTANAETLKVKRTINTTVVDDLPPDEFDPENGLLHTFASDADALISQ
jgi:hypothetical protein